MNKYDNISTIDLIDELNLYGIKIPVISRLSGVNKTTLYSYVKERKETCNANSLRTMRVYNDKKVREVSIALLELIDRL